MARHWSAFCAGVTERQGMALDRIARERGEGDGMDLLMRLTGCSRSKVGKMDRASLRPYLDDAFALRDAPVPRASGAAVLASAIGMPPAVAADALEEAGHSADAAALRRQGVLAQIRALMAEHGITAEELQS